MEDTINMIIKNIFISIYTMMIFHKISDYHESSIVDKIVIAISIVAFSFVYFFFRYNVDIVSGLIAVFILQMILLKILTRRKFSAILIATAVSTSISYLFFSVAAILEFPIQKILRINNVIINALCTFFIELIMVYFFLRIRKLKNGLIFLKKSNDYVEVLAINITIFVIVMYVLVGTSYEQIIARGYFYYVLMGVCIITTIYKTIVMYYKQKLMDDEILNYKSILNQKEKEIQSLTEEAFKVSKINHEFYNRQKSLELMVKNSMKNADMETSQELEILSRIREITAEHSAKMSEIKSLPNLPLTEIKEIDDMFKYMQSECKENGIQFELKINGNIHYMINNLIPVNKLETLIGDHVRDAIIAINSGNNSNKEVFVILGQKNEFYELCVLDTGIEFEIETLLKLGIEPATTHKDNGGTGIGFITTFETLKECSASLEIEEKHQMNETDYTKAVKIVFDGKHEYRINSYRADEIKQKTKDNRIVINNLKSN